MRRSDDIGCFPSDDRGQPPTPRVKVERTCPRCRVRAYHLGNDHGIAHRIACVNCGHEWRGRITIVENAGRDDRSAP